MNETAPYINEVKGATLGKGTVTSLVQPLHQTIWWLQKL